MPISRLHCKDCFVGLAEIVNNSIDLIVTDPPYFIDGMGAEWNKTKLEIKTKSAKVIGSLPVGMKFDPRQGQHFQEFSERLGKEYIRILKPGSFLLSFSQGRLYHRQTIAFEDCGFEIRDMLGWTYEGQAKAFSQNHFVKKMKISEDEKITLINSLGGRKTPQLKPMIEPICLAQKPKEGTFIENWQKWGVGLVDTSIKWNGKFPGNIIYCPKPKKSEKGEQNKHLTVKPLALMKHLIKVFSKPGDIVLDPFLGSGTTALAAFETFRQPVGFEINSDYYEIVLKRLQPQIFN